MTVAIITLIHAEYVTELVNKLLNTHSTRQPSQSSTSGQDSTSGQHSTSGQDSTSAPSRQTVQDMDIMLEKQDPVM